MAWFRKEKPPLESVEQKKVRTEGLWTKCDGCRQIVWKKDLEEGGNVCPKCGHHFRVDARTRLQMLFDGDWTEFDQNLSSNDPLHFVDLKAYPQKLAAARKATGLKDALISAEGLLNGRPVAICSMEIAFIGGSMGAVVGEKITRAMDRCIQRQAVDHRLVLRRCAHEGRRDQPDADGQDQRRAGAPGRARHALHHRAHRSHHRRRDGQLCHAGRLEYRRTGRVDRLRRAARDRADHPPETSRGFQRSEFLLKNGMLDAIVPRKELKGYIARALAFCCAGQACHVQAGG